jgi:hypothetical protein
MGRLLSQFRNAVQIWVVSPGKLAHPRAIDDRPQRATALAVAAKPEVACRAVRSTALFALVALCVLRASAAHAERLLVAVDFASLPDSLAQRLDVLALEQRVLQRLLQEQFAVVAPHANPDVLLGAEPIASGLRLIARSAEGEDTADLSLGSASRAELQLEIAQRLSDLGRTRIAAVESARPLPPPPERPRPPPFRQVRVEVPVPAPPPPPEVQVAFSVGADALWRAEVDPQLRVQAELRTRTPFALVGAAAFSSSTAPGLAVDEWQAQAGVAWRFLHAGRFTARAGALAGVGSHRFRFFGEQAEEPEGQRLDVLINFPVELLIAAFGPVELGFRAAPGLAGRAREHLRDGRPVWRREAARLEAGAFAGVAF